jgi:hypothetical protein
MEPCPVRALNDENTSASVVRNLQQYLCDKSPADKDDNNRMEKRRCFAFFKSRCWKQLSPTSWIPKLLVSSESANALEKRSGRLSISKLVVMIKSCVRNWKLDTPNFASTMHSGSMVRDIKCRNWCTPRPGLGDYGTAGGRLPPDKEGDNYDFKMSKVLLENIPLPDLDDPKSVVHRHNRTLTRNKTPQK